MSFSSQSHSSNWRLWVYAHMKQICIANKYPKWLADFCDSCSFAVEHSCLWWLSTNACSQIALVFSYYWALPMLSWSESILNILWRTFLSPPNKTTKFRWSKVLNIGGHFIFFTQLKIKIRKKLLAFHQLALHHMCTKNVGPKTNWAPKTNWVQKKIGVPNKMWVPK